LYTRIFCGTPAALPQKRPTPQGPAHTGSLVLRLDVDVVHPQQASSII